MAAKARRAWRELPRGTGSSMAGPSTEHTFYHTVTVYDITLERLRFLICGLHIGLKRSKVVFKSLYSATVASQSLPNGFPYCYRPILNIGIDRTWAHHAMFRLHTRDVAAARRGPPAFVTVVSTARAHSRRTTSSRPQKFAESRVQREQTRKTVRLRPSGSRNSVHTVRATTKERHATRRAGTPRNVHSHERARTSVPRPNGAGKAAAAAPAPTRWR